MSRLQLASMLLIALAATKRLPVGVGQQSSNSGSGYQYNKPSFGSDFGERPGGSGRPPAAPGSSYGPPSGLYGAPGGPGGQGGAGSGGSNGGGGQFGSNQGDQGSGSGGGRSRPYSFQYEVKDAATNNDYGQKESGDEFGSVKGEYRVLLPDTRMQIVRYTADDANGYLADVQYEGEAQFPRMSAGGGGGFAGLPPGGFQGRGGVGGGGPNDVFGGGGNQYLPPGNTYGK